MFQGKIKNVKSFIDEYIESFGEGIPLIMVKDSITEDQLIDEIEKAIDNKKEIPDNSFIYFKESEGEVI